MQESCIDHLNKKQKVADSIVQIFQENGLSVAEIIGQCKALARKFIIDLTSIVFSDWFYSVLLPHLTLKDIANFDIAVCNRKLRLQWLESLGKYGSSAPLKLFKLVVWRESLINWIVQRNVQFGELAIEKGYSEISNDYMYRLAQQCPNLKAFKLRYHSDIGDDERVQCLTDMCYKLERFELSSLCLKRSSSSDRDYVLLDACD